MDGPAQLARRTRGLRARLGTLVLRDALATYGVGLGLALMTLVYMWIAWPPPKIRQTLMDAAPAVRMRWFAGAHALYLISTHGITRQLLASARLEWWRQLPLPGSWWRGLHLRHLLLLHGPWFVMIAYAVAPAVRLRPLPALVAALGYAVLVPAAAIAMVALSDRSRLAAPAVGLLAAALSAAGVWSSLVLTLVSAPLLGLGVWRLGRPLPQVRASRVRLPLRLGPSLTLARAHLLGAWRRAPMAIAWVFAVHAIAIGLLAMAIEQQSPERARELQRGLAVIVAASSWIALVRGLRALAPDRGQLRSWPISPRLERRARLAVVALVAAPALLAGAPLLARAGEVGRWWALDLGLALTWAALVACAASFIDELRGTTFDPHTGRNSLKLGAALVLVTLTHTTLLLLPWALIEALRIPRLQARARAKLARIEREVHDDHGD